ncbi:MAG: glycolate oxidase subunit GlcF [Candidatus Thiodiazotropha sp. (ex Lucinoma borealis)]|nr:glycolate oxidase subunit GlcF [Candidatus Thiodiazotropha sp. (ex Lucinoma borealis)]
MQTQITSQILQSSAGREAETILRNCVHCGFCTATCPTYQLLGDELDSPRGRIYLIKQLLEGAKPSSSVQQHLDRCLLCRSCETTCPSGVEYGRLLEIGQNHLANHHHRRMHDRLLRWMLRKVVPNRTLFSTLLKLGQAVKPLLPKSIGVTIPHKAAASAHIWPTVKHPRKMVILDGCVQPSLAPSINQATAQVLDRLGISLIRTPQLGCCGAVEYHLDDQVASKRVARRNIDTWLPLLNGEAEALIITASGCAQMVKEYDHLLADDPDYASLARQLVSRTRDLAEIIDKEELEPLKKGLDNQIRVAFHASCTLQHGQGLSGCVEGILERLGYQLTSVADAHLCCGSAGTYSILQSHLADELGRRKSTSLQADKPEIIATANIGCLTHLQKSATRPVVHWIELLNATTPSTE